MRIYILFSLVLAMLIGIASASVTTNQTIAHGAAPDSNTASAQVTGMLINTTIDNAQLTSVKLLSGIAGVEGQYAVQIRTSPTGANLTEAQCPLAAGECIINPPFNLTKGTLYMIALKNNASIAIRYRNIDSAFPLPNMPFNGSFFTGYQAQFWGGYFNRTVMFESFNISQFVQDPANITVTLLTPSNNTLITIPVNSTSANVTFIANAIARETVAANGTLHIWYSNGTLITTRFNATSGTNVNYTFIVGNFSEGNYLWNVLVNNNNWSVSNSTFSVVETEPVRGILQIDFTENYVLVVWIIVLVIGGILLLLGEWVGGLIIGIDGFILLQSTNLYIPAGIVIAVGLLAMIFVRK